MLSFWEHAFNVQKTSKVRLIRIGNQKHEQTRISVLSTALYANRPFAVFLFPSPSTPLL